MEPQELITAKLVLGYLRSEKCKSTYKDFLRTSPNLRNLDYKYMPTRYLGHTLGEILSEYFEISGIVQGRLEATNYYNEDHPKMSLKEQLLYLLNKVPPSRTSTPITSTPHGSHGDYLSPDHSDVEATPVHTLPGNAESEKFYEIKSPAKGKSCGRYGKASPTPTNSPVHKNRAQVFDTEVLANNLMENTEFQEKIAQTINKVVKRQYEERNSEELDKTIRTAVEETEADPIFEELLQDIIGSSNSELNKNFPSTSGTCSISTNIKEKRRDNINSNTNESFSKSNRCGQRDVEPQTPLVDPFNQTLSGKEHVISYDSFSNYAIARNCNVVSRTPCIQNPVYINTMTGLIIPSNHNPAQPLVVLNNPTPVTSVTPLSEQEIMKMPIVLEENNEVLRNVTTEKKGQAPGKSTQLILPKPTIKVAPEAPEDVKDFFKNYVPIADDDPSPSLSTVEEPGKSEDITSIEIPIARKEAAVPKRTGLRKVIYPKATRKSPRPAKKPIPTSKPKKRDKNTPNDSTESNDNKTNASADVIEISSSSERLKTPAHAEPVKKPTPKSGSHVRNLNFCTPPKLSGRRKSNSPVSSQKVAATKTLFKQTESAQPWDAALRAAIPSEDLDTATTVKQPTSNAGKKSRKRTKAQLNATTEQEALLLEAAIRTPVKSSETDGNKSIVENAEELEKDVAEEYQNKPLKTILSPSKISNASKNILETQSGDGNTSAKFITPDMPKQNTTQPIKANRNVTPMLETPIKMMFPTPTVSTPIDVNMSIGSTTTPFTKMLEANLDFKGIDIGSIPTPNLPITPNFPPFTPTVDLISPYSNRPTDYSTGSSYYQPSDNEQNKHLEAHLREMEKAPTVVEVKETITISDHLQIFNKNIIGKKNLSLMRKNLENTDSSDSSSSEENSADDWCDKATNDTVILNKKKIETPKRYSLRTRSASTAEKSVSPKKKIVKTPKKPTRGIAKKEIRKPSSRGKKIETDIPDKDVVPVDSSAEDIKNILNEPKSTSGNSDSIVKGVTPSQLSVLKDLERKRLRMLDSLKPKIELSKTKKQSNSKFKIKPIANVYTSKKTKKSESPKKRKRTKELETVLNDLITSDDSDIDVSMVLDEDEEKVEKENKLLKIDKSDKTASDVEAQTLIEGLKERGIHLIHNKSPKKKNIEGGEKETVVNTSTTHLDTFDREAFDVKSFDGEDLRIVYDESQPQKEKKSIDNNKIQYIGQLFLESIGKEVEVHLKLTKFESLIDIESMTVFKDTVTVEKRVIENKKDVTRQEKLVESKETSEGVTVDSKEGELKSGENQSPEGKEAQTTREIRMDREDSNKITETTTSSKQSDDKDDEQKANEKELNEKQEVSFKSGSTSINKQISENVCDLPIKSKVKTKQTPESKKEKLENKIEVIKETAFAGMQQTAKTVPSSPDNKKPKTDSQKPENKKVKSDSKVESVEDKTEISSVPKRSGDKKNKTKEQQPGENKKEITTNKKDKQTTDTKNERLSTEARKEKPITETKKERPTVEMKKEKPTNETKKERLSTETKKEKITNETRKERLSTETKKEKPTKETRKERLSTETKKEKTTNETKKERLSTETKKENTTNETKKERLSTETKKENTTNETKKERLSTEKQTAEARNRKQSESKSATPKEMMAKVKPTDTSVAQIETSKKPIENELKIEIVKHDTVRTEHKEVRFSLSSIQKTPNRRDSYQSGIDKDIDDDLMNFAITGREAESSSVQSTSTKRRLSDEDACENPAKKMLKSLDVDKFLNTIHAGTTLGQKK